MNGIFPPLFMGLLLFPQDNTVQCLVKNKKVKQK
ncbi:hypothetical protein Desru_3728 [Desulforamulus ruminis DSM 2154]|uniref:Uncharacterized protein n=1 Tax=Desulforamulus ruminis (strain ATCC 23193 / DSM 2154 / NCIMB 8452 / DL) TaxID=696281 RepID=F6DP99_DESRL|nr:hypothetical protein Desru_3728 [Desulforamulus ruminis DSM 2154]